MGSINKIQEQLNIAFGDNTYITKIDNDAVVFDSTCDYFEFEDDVAIKGALSANEIDIDVINVNDIEARSINGIMMRKYNGYFIISLNEGTTWYKVKLDGQITPPSEYALTGTISGSATAFRFKVNGTEVSAPVIAGVWKWKKPASMTITSLSNAFSGRDNLLTVDLTNLNTASCIDTSEMFANCTSLTSIIGINAFNTSSVLNMEDMFYNCSNLTNLPVKNFNVSNVTNMEGMFQGCDRLTALDLSTWNTSSVANIDNTFKDCSSLTNLKLDSWTTTQILNYVDFVDNRNSLNVVYDSSKWNDAIPLAFPNVDWSDIYIPISYETVMFDVSNDTLIENEGIIETAEDEITPIVIDTTNRNIIALCSTEPSSDLRQYVDYNIVRWLPQYQDYEQLFYIMDFDDIEAIKIGSGANIIAGNDNGSYGFRTAMAQSGDSIAFRYTYNGQQLRTIVTIN